MTVSADFARTVVDPKAYADGRIDPVFARLRREAPVGRIVAEGYRPFWLVTRHADVMEAGRRADDFNNGGGPITLTSIAAEHDMAQHPGGVRTLVQMDALDHLAFRRLTQVWFMPPNLRTIEGRIREIAREFVDRLAAFGGECDFAHDIALYYPLRVIMEILGVPEPDEPLMLKLTQEMFGPEDEELTRAGQPAKGDWMMLSYASANRDEAVFDRPFEYDVHRSPNRHVAFGHGPHVCLGQHLGRMEMRILWEELLPRLDSLELAGEPILTSATFISGPKHVPIRFSMT
jgi:cytochrome P450